jgi:hypothetical protein
MALGAFPFFSFQTILQHGSMIAFLILSVIASLGSSAIDKKNPVTISTWQHDCFLNPECYR